MSDTSEHELYQWLLEQRLLHEAGQLDPAKVKLLDEKVPGWDEPVTDADGAHALSVDHPELNSAFESWWNVKGMPGSPMTFAEIRVKAAMER